MEILNKIQEYLLSNGFKQESDLVFNWGKVLQVGSTQQIIINGQVIQQKPHETIRKVTVEFFGPGYIKDETGEKPFEEVRFKVEDLDQGGKSGNGAEMIEGFYEEDFERVRARIDGMISF